ncbi:MAG TPA: c-type cytochrome [Anaerolineales bacterium]|jgi:mono/diheme cytochrome c family protein|nr:c-type cytochrome [Anaerolineales bacterium]
MRLLRQLVWVFTVLGVLLAVLLLFTYDIIKIEWISFMEIQPSHRQMEDPLPVPARSIPIEGPVSIPGMLPPENPIEANEASIARGSELFEIHCKMCHGQTAEGNGPIAPFLANKPANLTSPIVQSKSDGSIFLTITNGVEGKMPPMNENLLVPDRWDLVNFIRTLTVED